MSPTPTVTLTELQKLALHPSPASSWRHGGLLNHYVAIYRRWSDNELVAILMIPNLLGGFPVIYLHNFSVRSESDLLSPFPDTVSYMLQYHPEMAQILLLALRQKTANSDRCFNGLLVDPYSLPLVKPRPVTSTVIKQAVSTELVRRRTLN